MRPLALKAFHYLGAKSGALVLGVAAFALLANLSLAAIYMMEVREQETLVSDIESTRQAISEYSRPLTIQRLLAETNVSLAAEQKAFPSQVSGLEVARELLNLAAAQGLTVTETSTRSGETRDVGQHTYQALLVMVQVTGTGEAFQTFLQELEGGALPGARIDEVNISNLALSNPEISSGHPEDTGVINSETTLMASLTISVYERQEGAD